MATDHSIRPIGGSAYKGKEPLDHVFVDKQARDLVIGQRDVSARSRASICLGKVIERVPATDFFDYNFWLDVEFPHVVFVAGKRGSGKSYDLGLIVEGLGAADSNIGRVPNGFAAILFDLQSQFWALGNSLNPDLPEDQGQIALLNKWNVIGVPPTPTLYLPNGCRSVTGTECPLTIPPRALEVSDWLALLGATRFEPIGQLLATCLQIVLRARQDFEIADIIQVLQNWTSHPDLQAFQAATVDALSWRLSALIQTQLFRAGTNPADAMLRANTTSIVLMRELPDDLKAVVVAVLMRHVERGMARHQQERKIALRKGHSVGGTFPNRVWVLIDEAHLVCPAVSKTSANEVIVDYVKRGRDAGLSLVLATQQPSAIDTSAISQVDVTVLHKLTVDADIASATAKLPAPLPTGVRVRDKDISEPRLLIRELLPGEAIVSDSEASRALLVRFRPRLSPHGGGEPLL